MSVEQAGQIDPEKSKAWIRSADMSRRAALLSNISRRARLIVRSACNGHFDMSLDVDKKDDGSKVSRWDYAINTMAITLVREVFSFDRVLGEEVCWPGRKDSDGHTWLIDPIDGTSDFIAQLGEGASGDCQSAFMGSLLAPSGTSPYFSIVSRLIAANEDTTAMDMGNYFASNQDEYPEPTGHPGGAAQRVFYEHHNMLFRGIRMNELFPGLKNPDRQISLGLNVMKVATGDLCCVLYTGRPVKPHDYVPPAHIFSSIAPWGYLSDLDGRTFDEMDCTKPIKGLLVARSPDIGRHVLEILDKSLVEQPDASSATVIDLTRRLVSP